jgi:hypothetical protein
MSLNLLKAASYVCGKGRLTMAAREYDQTNIRAVAKELVEKTNYRRGKQYLLVDSEYVEQLAEIVGVTIGARAERGLAPTSDAAAGRADRPRFRSRR